MSRAKTLKNADKFRAAVDYVAEYSSVIGAVIADNEGMVITWAGTDQFDPELYGAIGLQIGILLDGQIEKLFDPGVQYAVIKTNRDWLTIARSDSFLFVVAASKDTDDLLHIRVSRALEMVNSHMKNTYPNALKNDKPGDRGSQKNMEEIHV